MDPQSKEKTFLTIAADLTRFYALMGHALRIVTDRAVRDQMSVDHLEEQFRQSREKLSPELEMNPVVRKKVEADYASTMDILKRLKRRKGGTAVSAKMKKEAVGLQAYAQDRTSSLSDLVAIFRSL